MICMSKDLAFFVTGVNFLQCATSMQNTSIKFLRANFWDIQNHISFDISAFI